MRALTIGEIKQAVRELADIVTSQVVTDSELLRYINDAYTSLYSILISTDEDYNLNFSNFTLDPQIGVYNLPANFYKLRGVEFKATTESDPIDIRVFKFRERNRYGGALRYRILGNTITFVGNTAQYGFITLWYYPAPTKYTEDSQILDGVAGWEKLVIIEAAIKCKLKQELDATDLKEEWSKYRAEIFADAQARDHNEGSQVTDIRGLREGWDYDVIDWRRFP